MKTVTREEAEASRDYVDTMSDDETLALVEEMVREQPALQLYVAAICERGDFEDENDMDAFANLSIIVWHAMRKAAGGQLAEIKEPEIDRREQELQKLLDDLQDESEERMEQLSREWRAAYNQGTLYEFVLEVLQSPENDYDVTEADSGLIAVYIRLVIDCLDNAPLSKAPESGAGSKK